MKLWTYKGTFKGGVTNTAKGAAKLGEKATMSRKTVHKKGPGVMWAQSVGPGQKWAKKKGY